MIRSIALHSLAKQTRWVFLCGLLLAGIAFGVTWDRQHRIWVNELEQEVLENTLILGGKLAVVERELLGVLSLFNASKFVSREEFQTYVQPILKNNRYIQSLNWVSRVPHPRRKVYERNIESEGYPGFQITERSGQGRLSPAPDRGEYFPVSYVEPSEGNNFLLGFDMASIPGLHKVIRQATDTGQPTATEMMMKFRNQENQAGIFVFAPFYTDRKIPPTVDERRKKLKGFIVGFYRIRDMMRQMIEPYQAKGINLVIFDGDAGGENNRLYGNLLPDPLRQIRHLINFSGRIWFLVWQGSPAFHNGPQVANAFWVGGTILTLAIFMTIIFQMMASRTRQVESEVRSRTEELTETNQRLKSEIAARGKVENALHAAKEEADWANRAKSIFLANMSHEIRTPMNAILGYAQILKGNKTLEPKLQHNVQNILTSGDHLLHLINDILDISKIEAGKMEIHPTNFDLNELIRNISSMIGPRCEEKNIRWKVQGFVEGPLPVYGDEIKLKQIFINLLGNAVKFTDSGQISLKVTPQNRDQYLFEISDSGKGIPKEHREHIFDPFQQETDGIKTGGTGLGLSIVKRLTELMHGTLGLDTEPGRGSRFFFSLPLPSARGKVTRGLSPAARGFHLPDGVRLQALVADDNLQNRDMLSQILENAGFEVVTAKNGKEAIEQVRKRAPDIIFMDLRMPVMGGAEAIRTIKKEYGSIKTVAISASAFEHQREKTLKAGFDDFISKPFQIERIFDCLGRLLHVDFVQEEAESSRGKFTESKNLDLPDIRLPGDLIDRFKKAADLSNITDLKTCMKELETLGEDGRSLLEHLKPLAGQYDMNGIMNILEQVPHERKP
ncbi:MAG: CHASE domain-containing protein [Nitrospinaceae bacterium]